MILCKLWQYTMQMSRYEYRNNEMYTSNNRDQFNISCVCMLNFITKPWHSAVCSEVRCDSAWLTSTIVNLIRNLQIKRFPMMCRCLVPNWVRIMWGTTNRLFCYVRYCSSHYDLDNSAKCLKCKPRPRRRGFLGGSEYSVGTENPNELHNTQENTENSSDGCILDNSVYLKKGSMKIYRGLKAISLLTWEKTRRWKSI